MKRGFTLLEVMISLAILAVALVALSGLNGGAVQMQAYARRATQATLLLRGKMSDIEEQLQKEGFSDFSDDKHGTFDDDEGAKDYEWRAEILKPDVQMDASQLLQLLGAGQGAAGGAAAGAAPQPTGAAPGGVGSLTAPGSPIAGVLQNQATTFLETLKKSVREVRVTVSWKDGSQERNISASQHVVILPEMVGKAGQTPTQPKPRDIGQ
ncbi:MAG: prepilin-type N-terminal cleavage/methylation domain-containing protein [Myxococcales bacterium]